MKKLLILLPLLILLTGCVTYYYPQTALQDGVYYAEDDPSYVVYSNSYSGVAYYPWSSLDYFYMGYHPYPRYGYGGGWSFEFGYGYSPWYYPYGYYGYYSPWYASYYHYPYYPAWRSYHGYYSRHGGGHHRGGGHERYAGNDHNGRANRNDEIGDRNEDRADRRSRENQINSYNTSRVSRYVSTAPAGYSDNRGMVIRSRDTAKMGKSRLEPVKSAPVATTNVTPASYRGTQRDYQRSRSDNEVRYSSGAKQSRARTGPVESSPDASGIAINAAPQRTVVAGGNDGDRSVHSAPPETTRQASGRPPATSRSNAPASNSNRSRSPASRSSFSGQRGSKQSSSSRREHRK